MKFVRQLPAARQCKRKAMYVMAQAGRESGAEGPLPLLVSSCPGWVVYAEKTHGSYVLPYLSKAKSPQVWQHAPKLSQTAASHSLLLG